MTTSEDAWNDAAEYLCERCQHAAQDVAERLRGPITEEANRLLAEGFIVTGPSALAHAADVFDNISKLAPQEAFNQIGYDKGVRLVCAFINAVHGIEREWDLDGLAGWWQWREQCKEIGDGELLMQRLRDEGLEATLKGLWYAYQRYMSMHR